MADAVAKFAVALEDFVSPGANKASSSIDHLSSSLRTAKTQLSGYKAQLSIAKELGDVEGYRKYSALVQQGKERTFALAQQLEGASAQLGAGSTEAGELAAGLGLVAAGAAVAVAGLVAVAAATEKLVVKALEVTNANQQMAASFEALGGAGSGKKTLALVDDLSEKLPQSREQIAEWTQQIQKAGVTDLGKIRSELIATASAQAILGEGGAAAYEKISRKVQDAEQAHHALKITSKELTRTIGINLAGDVAKKMGMSLGDLETRLKAGTIDAKKFGDALEKTMTEKGRGPLDVMMNSLTTMGHKVGEALSHLFDDVDTKPLTDALRNLIALGDQGAPSGEALKTGLTGGLNAVIRALGRAITEGEIFFLETEVHALQAYIALKPLIGGIEKISSVLSAIGAAPGQVGAAAAKGLGASDAKVAEGQSAAGSLGGAVVTGLTGQFTAIPSLFMGILEAIGGAQAQEIARQGGLQVGQATIAGIREGTQTHSPSLEAIRIGMGIGEGLGAGMEDSPAPERASRTISANALGGLAGGAAGAFGGAPANSNGSTSNVFNIAITAPEGVTDAHAISVAGLAAALERYQIASGR